MACNLQLAKERGLSEDDIIQVNLIHEEIENKIDAYLELGWSKEREEDIHDLEFILQGIWKFPQSRIHHTWAKRFKFASQWYKRKFLDPATGKVFTFGKKTLTRDWITIGNSAIDTGDGFYHRMIGSLVEICTECERELGTEHKMSCSQRYKEKSDVK